MEPAEILDAIQELGGSATIKGGELHVRYPSSAAAKIMALGPEITRRKTDLIGLLASRSPQPAAGRVLGGHLVQRVIWETEKVVIFQDEDNRYWRYLYDYRQAWPVVVEGDHQQRAS